MLLSRPGLTILLNTLYVTDTTPLTLSHPSDAIGDLLRIDLGDPDASTVRLEQSIEAYGEARSAVDVQHGTPAVTEVPEPRSYLSGLLAGGLVEPANLDEIQAFLDREGSPDLTAGHRPVVAGFDTNLLPWRIADVLDFEAGQDGVINGYALASGIREELDWDRKRSNTRAIEDALGDEFDALWNQPAGAGREGRLGYNYYLKLRNHRYGDEFSTETGDEPIVQGYADYQHETDKKVLLFSNDRDFVERAKGNRVLAQRVEFPDTAPRSVEVSWNAICDTLYVLAVLFGVLELPKVTLYGVWPGKEGQAWQDEALEVECRSPKVEVLLERDLQIVRARSSS